jgi:hypothetical protein
MRWRYLNIAVLLVFISVWVRGWRWKELFERNPPPISLLAAAVAIGQTLNYVIPFRSGEIARVFMVGGKKLEVAGTIAVEKFLDVGFFAGICLLLPLVWVMPDWMNRPRMSALVMAGAYLVGIVALAVIVPRFTSLPRLARMPPLDKLPALLATSLLLWVGGVLVNYFVFHALQIEASLLVALVLLVILQLGQAVPSSPGKVGVFQYLAVLGLSLFGVSKAPALAFGLVLHLVVFLPVAIIAGVFWATHYADSRG